MKKISTTSLVIFLGVVAFLLGGWIYLLSKNQKMTADALANTTNKLDDITDKLNDIIYREQALELANIELRLLETQQQKNIQPIGFKTSENSNDNL